MNAIYFTVFPKLYYNGQHFSCLLEAQLLYLYIYVRDSLLHSVYFFLPCLPSLRFCHLEFDKEAISDILVEHSLVFRGGGVEFKYFRELSYVVLMDLVFLSFFIESMQVPLAFSGLLV